MGSAVDGVFGGDVVDHGAGVIAAAQGPKALVLPRAATHKHALR